jgi:hypothetical protein
VHDGGGNREQTVAALTKLIPKLIAKGWTFDRPAVTVQSHPLPGPHPSASPTGQTSPSQAPSSQAPSDPVTNKPPPQGEQGDGDGAVITPGA